jgi:hypothetical protein
MNPLPSKKEAAARQILELIDAAMELAQTLGAHPLRPGCPCMACVVKRKHLFDPSPKSWRFTL